MCGESKQEIGRSGATTAGAGTAWRIAYVGSAKTISSYLFCAMN
uniref:Uncharacterized protein n=1 Tax=Physcomitrium patens TaxID=3218 RepID=A0A2K1IMG3_PHYPA|nr:hypothetical protein PHYPA_026780 [Physcomitrium patens]